MSRPEALDGLIECLRSGRPAVRIEAAETLGDWLYPRGGLSPRVIHRIHQALLDAAVVETDAEAAEAQLDALIRSERPLLGLTGWSALVEAAPAMASAAQDLALALLSVSGDPAIADRLAALSREQPHFDRALVRKTIDGIRRAARSS